MKIRDLREKIQSLERESWELGKLKLNIMKEVIIRERLKEHLGVLNRKRIGELKEAWQVAFDSESWYW